MNTVHVREREREREREGRREGGREGGKEGGREGGREGGYKNTYTLCCIDLKHTRLVDLTESAIRLLKFVAQTSGVHFDHIFGDYKLQTT